MTTEELKDKRQARTNRNRYWRIRNLAEDMFVRGIATGQFDGVIALHGSRRAAETVVEWATALVDACDSVQEPK